jgi:hypothetical protein
MLDRKLNQDRELRFGLDRVVYNRSGSRNLRSLVPISLMLLIFTMTFLPLILAGYESGVKFWNSTFPLNETGTWNITLDASAQWAYSVHEDANRTINVTYPAKVTRLEITDQGLDYSRMSLSPVEGSTSDAAIRATIYDTDGITGLNVTAYICDVEDYASCSDSTYTYAQNLTYLEPAGTDEYYYIYNGTDNTPQFWKQSGIWKLYVKVIDSSTTNYNETDFSYSTLMAINISTNITLGSGTATLGQWNSGTDEYTITNLGNLNLSLTWNASDMESGIDTWQLNGTDFAIDDDNDYSDYINNLAMVYLNATTKSFQPSSGLLRCDSDSCVNENSTLDTYYHIAPPLGLKAGTYNTTITIKLSQKD